MIKMTMKTKNTINVLYFRTLSGSCKKEISRARGVNPKQHVEMVSRSSSSGVLRGAFDFVVNNLCKLFKN